MAPQRAKMDKNAEKFFSLYFLFIVAFSSALGSFCSIPPYPSSYNTVDTVLDPRKWPNNDQKWTKTPKNARKKYFLQFFFLQLHFPLLQGHFAPSRTILALIIRQICHTLQNSAFQIWPKIENHPKMGQKCFFFEKLFLHRLR